MNKWSLATISIGCLIFATAPLEEATQLTMSITGGILIVIGLIALIRSHKKAKKAEKAKLNNEDKK